MLPVVWLESADEDLHAIVAYIRERNPSAALALAEHLIEDADNLGLLSALYRRGRVAGTHEFVSHPNYILVYRQTLTAIEVLNVIHARQRYPF